jgi:valyl-tRNA synthetase
MEISQNVEMATAFDPHPVEVKWYEFWQEQKYFHGTDKAGKPHYCITIPPPNVTGSLHLGHALQHAIHDCLIRYHRMKGDNTLCVPGTDHASIATQVKVENKLRDELGKTRHDVGREEFLKHAWEWKEKYGNTIIGQLKSLGCSYDWDGERFTMDEGYSRAVLTVFKKWYDDGLIYRGLRLVNWSPGAQTTVSDLEIEYRDVQSNLWHLKYPVIGSDEFIIVATTRPETMLGDTAVAVNPRDERYKNLIGKKVLLPLMNREIPIIADDMVDREFGSGAVKITPAHDPNDYETGLRHNLEQITVIGFDAKMTEAAVDYAGLSREEARRAVVRDLKAQDLLEKIEPYTHSVGHCQRTGSVIEPLLSEQWFVAMKKLAAPVAEAIRAGRVKYVPERFAQTSLEWLDNIRDWCISRQLWWGHRIPVYYGPDGEIEVSLEPITKEGWRQDEDVLDTWFSSALWPFAVLGWPDNLQKQWYPTSVLITGRDILNLWVSRMMMTSLYFLDGEIPFHEVMVHPTVQDCFGLRMSKSLGTGIDPMGLVETYGADATRFGLLQLATGTQDVRFIDNAEVLLGETKVRACVRKGEPIPLVWDGKPGERYPQMLSARNFANKIWNAARLVLSASDGTLYSASETTDVDQEKDSVIARECQRPWQSNSGQIATSQAPRNDTLTTLPLEARWILSRLSGTIQNVTQSLENYEFERAAGTLYEFLWGDFCDWSLELAKPALHQKDKSTFELLSFVMDQSLRLLHPFMPFLSEEIWQKLPRQVDDPISLCIAAWPKSTFEDKAAEADFAAFQETVRAIRNLRAEAKIPPSQKVKVLLFISNPEKQNLLELQKSQLADLAALEEVLLCGANQEHPANALSAKLPWGEIYLPMEGQINIEAEIARLEKDLVKQEQEWDRVNKKLSNAAFVDKAPENVVQKENAKRDTFAANITNLRERIIALSG